MTDWPDGTVIKLTRAGGQWYAMATLPDGTRYDAVGPNRLIVLADLDVQRDKERGGESR